VDGTFRGKRLERKTVIASSQQRKSTSDKQRFVRASAQNS